MKSKLNRALGLMVLAGCMSLLAAAPSLASEPRVAPNPVGVPGVVRWQVGEFEVFALSDQRVVLNGVTAYAVRRGSTVVLINAGRGARQGHDLGRVAENLKSVGIAPEEVAAVFLTSMHADQVSGLLTQDDLRQYPNASLFASPAAMQHWLADYSYVQAPDDHKLAFAATITSVMPYVKAGKLHAADEGLVLMPGMKVLPLSGSTPGHVGYLIESGAHKLLITGDQAASPADRRKAVARAAQQKWQIADAFAPFPGLQGRDRNRASVR